MTSQNIPGLLGVHGKLLSEIVIQPNEPLERHTTLRIGGPAEFWAEVSSEAQLRLLLHWARSRSLPVTVFGLGSNVLVPDEGLPGLVLRLVGSLARIRVHGRFVQAGAGAVLAQVARSAVRRGLSGLEALAGFPSSVGGAVFMNAGCYGSEISQVLRRVRLMDPVGRTRHVPAAELEPGYRRTNLSHRGELVTRVLFELSPGNRNALEDKMRALNARRRGSLPSGFPNAGSVFKNPPGDFAGRLIEACGLKGLRIGGGEISERHANVFVNRGGARAEEILELMVRARASVWERFGIELEPEIQLLGNLRARFERSRPSLAPTAQDPASRELPTSGS
jgi:UDP-N-acetylmuramate dehydrogenase